MGRHATKPARRRGIGLGRFLCFRSLVRTVDGDESCNVAPNAISGHPGGVQLARESPDSGAAILEYLGLQQIAHCASSSSVLLQAAHAAALERSLNAVEDDSSSSEALSCGLSRSLISPRSGILAEAQAGDSPLSLEQSSSHLLESQMVWDDETQDSRDAKQGGKLAQPPTAGGSSSGSVVSVAAKSLASTATQSTPANPIQLEPSLVLSTPEQSTELRRGLVQSSDGSGLHSSGMPSPRTTSSALSLPALRCLAGDAPDPESETDHAASTGYQGSCSVSSELTTPPEPSGATRIFIGTELAARPPRPPSSSTRCGSLVEIAACLAKYDSLGNGACLHRGDEVRGGEQTAARSVVMRRHTAVVLMGDSSSDEDGPENVSPPARRTKSVQRRLSGVYEGHHVHLQKLRKQMGDTNEPPGDLLALMARRVFSSQGVMARVNSDGVISGMDARSSFNTPSILKTPSSDIVESPSLPRIRTRASTTNASTHF